MSVIDSVRNVALNFLFPASYDPVQKVQQERYSNLKDYAAGRQKRQLVQRPMQADDNIVLNFMTLIIERSISMLFGKAIKFDLPGEDTTPEAEYIDNVWKANKQGILLHRLGQLGGVYGTAYVKMVPDGIKHNGNYYPRLIALKPYYVRVTTDPEDMEKALKYVIEYVIMRDNGKEQARREVTEAIMSVEERDGQIFKTSEIAMWTVSHYIADETTGGRWVETDTSDWPYTFPPIIHWQNLPEAESCYGRSDIEDVLNVQDRYNFIQSNNSKIIRYHAHPKTWAKGIGASSSSASWGADEMVTGGDAFEVHNLEMNSDLAASRTFALDIRQALFDISRTVDMTSMADKLGALTNFGLRVLFMDALNKNDTKRQLYGDALIEINRRLLILAQQAGDDEADGGSIVWPDALPVNEVEQAAALTQDLSNGLVSKQTASEDRGYKWAQEEERLAGQQTAGDNIGAAILRNFGRGQ